MNSIHDPRYVALIEALKALRREKDLSQQDLATLLDSPQSFVSKVELFERRLDMIEVFDYVKALGTTPEGFLKRLGWISQKSPVAVPIAGEVKRGADSKTIMIPMTFQEGLCEVEIGGTTRDTYLDVENYAAKAFRALNTKGASGKNRDVICDALFYAIKKMPKINPSDIYQHIIYRIYIREYVLSDATQSWVRAGGEAVELFIEKMYAERLKKVGLSIKALLGRSEKAAALNEMGLKDSVGDSKLDIALYGELDGRKVIFGGLHAKASLAERVSDDETCSKAMLGLGLFSALYTFDSKSFPPPNGDLINRGELGSDANPSDKRRYITDQGSFSCCFCYNTRASSTKKPTKSGSEIYVSTFEDSKDPLVEKVSVFWKQFKKGLR